MTSQTLSCLGTTIAWIAHNTASQRSSYIAAGRGGALTLRLKTQPHTSQGVELWVTPISIKLMKTSSLPPLSIHTANSPYKHDDIILETMRH